MNKEFKIIKIIDDKSIVINAGSEDNVANNDEFQIYNIGEEIIDEDTKKSLGTLDTIKTTVTAVTVLPKMCICKKITSKIYSPLQASLFKQEEEVLNVDLNDISGGLLEDLVIKVGDKARLIKKINNN